MRRRLLDLILCPGCGGTFLLKVFKEQAVQGWEPGGVACAFYCAREGRALTRGQTDVPDCAGCYTSDVVEGGLQCERCGAKFPIINGVPRLLAPDLLARMQVRYPDFFLRHPAFLPAPEASGSPLGDTMDSFTRQRLDLTPPGPEFAAQWEQHLRRNLGASVEVEALRNKLVLDVGCGFGRHLYVASRAGAEAVGVDLSGGVDVARRNNEGHPRCHIVQADIMEGPLRQGAFDIVWSFGVLHHMPVPRLGFKAIAPLARPERGLIVIWVYGWEGMAFTYRLSHMRFLHGLVRKMSETARVRASKGVAFLLSALYWEPLRLARRSGLGRWVDRLPLTVYVEHNWRARVAGVHDRLSTPITHFHGRDELLGWMQEAELIERCVQSTDRRGWRGYGWRHGPLEMREAV